MTTRREFLKISASVLAGATVLTQLGAPAQAAAPEALDENSAAAKALNYKNDAAQVTNKAQMIARQGVAFKDQKCSNCSFYTGKAGAANGPCSIFPNKTVAAKGWCQIWAKKA
jgi:hypothetical protein